VLGGERIETYDVSVSRVIDELDGRLLKDVIKRNSGRVAMTSLVTGQI
jgi:hypothetical protein